MKKVISKDGTTIAYEQSSTKKIMESYDDDLSRFEADGAAPLPVTNDQGYVEYDGAQIGI